MKREDLESRVLVTWERNVGDDRGVRKCVASLQLRAEALLDPVVKLVAPVGAIEGKIEEHLKGLLVHRLLGGIESERARLRAAVEKWGRRAISRQFPSRERRNEQDAEENELKEDLE